MYLSPILWHRLLKKDIKKDWYIIDAENVAVGRLAAFISKVLRGKNKPTFNPHIDNGDFVVVTNIDKIKFTGKNLIIKNIIGTQVIQVVLRKSHPPVWLKKIRLRRF